MKIREKKGVRRGLRCNGERKEREKTNHSIYLLKSAPFFTEFASFVFSLRGAEKSWEEKVEK